MVITGTYRFSLACVVFVNQLERDKRRITRVFVPCLLMRYTVAFISPLILNHGFKVRKRMDTEWRKEWMKSGGKNEVPVTDCHCHTGLELLMKVTTKILTFELLNGLMDSLDQHLDQFLPLIQCK